MAVAHRQCEILEPAQQHWLEILIFRDIVHCELCVVCKYNCCCGYNHPLRRHGMEYVSAVVQII